jgi:hypothetical protein
MHHTTLDLSLILNLIGSPSPTITTNAMKSLVEENEFATSDHISQKI